MFGIFFYLNFLAHYVARVVIYTVLDNWKLKIYVKKKILHEDPECDA